MLKNMIILTVREVFFWSLLLKLVLIIVDSLSLLLTPVVQITT